MGDRVETEESDEELAAIQMGERHEECDKGWFEDFDESKIIEMPSRVNRGSRRLQAERVGCGGRGKAPPACKPPMPGLVTRNLMQGWRYG